MRPVTCSLRRRLRVIRSAQRIGTHRSGCWTRSGSNRSGSATPTSSADLRATQRPTARRAQPAGAARAAPRKQQRAAATDAAGEAHADEAAGLAVDGEAGISALNAIGSKRPHLLWKIGGLSDALVEQIVRRLFVPVVLLQYPPTLHPCHFGSHREWRARLAHRAHREPSRSRRSLARPLPSAEPTCAPICFCGVAQHCTAPHSARRSTSAPGLGSRLPHLYRDWAHPCHICTGTGLIPATSAPGWLASSASAIGQL